VLGFAVIRWGVARGWSTIEGVIAAGLVCLIAASLLRYLVELPGGRWVRTALSRRQPPAMAA
jgi:peptidoglycan/LPS O-acetylase OafA/YrhL